MKGIHAELQKNIYTAVDDLYSDAVIYQEMWMRNIAKRELSLSSADYQNGQGINYQLSIDFSGSAFLVRWLKYRFIRNNKKLVRLTKSVSIPKFGKYKRAQFKDASEWELSLILEIEEHLAPIRNEIKNLMKMHFYLGYSVSSSDGKLTPIKMVDRVEIPTFSIKHFKEQMS